MDENLSSKRYEPSHPNPDDTLFSPTLLREIEYTGYNKKVLEIGTSTGYVTKILKEHGNSVTGIEIDPDAGSAARQYCDRMIIADVEILDFDRNFEPAFFDVIICGDVLEHLKKPGVLLKKLRKFLRADGYLVVSLPNFCHGDVLLNIINGDFHYTPMGLLDETHLRFFGLKNIYSIFSDCGFQVRDMQTTNLAVGTTELKADMTKIPEDLLQFIRSLPDSTVYQYVFRAYPSESVVLPESLGTDIRSLFFNSLQVSKQEFQAPLVATIDNLNNSLTVLKQQQNENTILIEELKRDAAEGTEQIDELNVKTQTLDRQLNEKNNQLDEFSFKVQSLDRQLTEKNNQLDEFSFKVQSLDRQLTEKNSQLEEFSFKVQSLDRQLTKENENAKHLAYSLSLKQTQLQNLTTALAEREQKLSSIEHSIVWRFTMRFHSKVIERIFPQKTNRRKYYDLGLKSCRILIDRGFFCLIQEYKKRRKFLKLNTSPIQFQKSEIEEQKNHQYGCTGTIPCYTNYSKKPLKRHAADVEIIICIHNAYNDVKLCLESVIKYSSPPYSLILIDDGSEDPTRNFVKDFAQIHNAISIRNDSARGYTFAANQGLKASSAPYVILLNSDTIVTYEWLDRIIECAESDKKIGLVGPLSNTASWQSVPDIEMNGDWANNALPEGISVHQMSRFIAKYSSRTYPRLPFINGFCLFIKRDVIRDIGFFDEENFGEGYGEENDYCIRARNAGWEFAVADDVYIYHAQSRSYSDEKRKQLCERSDRRLHEKHGTDIILKGVAACKNNKVLMGIRARTRVLFNRNQILLQGRKRFEGKRILVILPICDPGGGAYVVIQECTSMIKMGVDVRLFNLVSFKPFFEKNFPELEIPVIYGNTNDLGTISRNFDAILCTTNGSVSWIHDNPGKKITAYYVQDFEPDFYPSHSADYERAFQSYSEIPDMIKFTKTRWTHDRVKEKTGIECAIIGCSVDIDMFHPLSPSETTSNEDAEPVRVTAMIRPSTSRRNPQLTLELLRDIKLKYKDRVFIQTFGCSTHELSSIKSSCNFSFCHSGLISRAELVSLFNSADIFLDCSSFQAMGLTALEAMACGVAVIVPKNGGCKEVITDRTDGYIVDTESKSGYLDALEHLISDNEFRRDLSNHSITGICEFFPERAAYNILETIFGDRIR